MPDSSSSNASAAVFSDEQSFNAGTTFNFGGSGTGDTSNPSFVTTQTPTVTATTATPSGSTGGVGNLGNLLGSGATEKYVLLGMIGLAAWFVWKKF